MTTYFQDKAVRKLAAAIEYENECKADFERRDDNLSRDAYETAQSERKEAEREVVRMRGYESEGTYGNFHDPTDKDFLLSYLPYSDRLPYPTRYSSGSYEEFFRTRAEANRRLHELISEGRVEKADVYQADSKYPLGRKLVDEWEDVR